MSRAAGTLGSSQSGIRSPEDSSVSPGCRRELSTRCERFRGSRVRDVLVCRLMGGLSKCAANDSICGVEIVPM